MSTFEAHCQESKVRFGQEFKEVHRWLNEFQGTPKYQMRQRQAAAKVRQGPAMSDDIFSGEEVEL
jgi:hypothetical protein